MRLSGNRSYTTRRHEEVCDVVIYEAGIGKGRNIKEVYTNILFILYVLSAKELVIESELVGSTGEGGGEEARL